MGKLLEIKGLSKKFDNTVALDKVDFDLKANEIHGLIGANGSGKSTMMNILFGSRQIKNSGGYEGSIFIEGKSVNINNNKDSRQNGIGMVHQELTLLSDLDIGENIKINREKTLESTRFLGEFSLVDNKANHEDSKKALSRVGVDIDSKEKVKNLPTNIKQFVEIAREIDKDKLKILLLDEPTSSLNLEQTKILLEHLKDLAKMGTSIIFTSHRLEEVMAVCDRVTVLRDGLIVNTYEKEDYSLNQLALDMIGKEVVQVRSEKREKEKEDIISFKKVRVSVGNKTHKNISLDIKKGEILGITGLAGHGQEMFGYGLMGIYQMSGEIFYQGKPLKTCDSIQVTKKGIYLLADERKEMGLLINDSIWKNIIFESFDMRKEFLRYPKLGQLSPLHTKVINTYTENMIEDLNIKARDIEQKVWELSGGNQQKVCVARAITVNPKVLFVGEPTRGIDLYSKEIILSMLLELNKKNKTTVVVSSGEISELKRICDRIVVMYENQVFKIFDQDFDSEEFALAMSGKEKT